MAGGLPFSDAEVELFARSVMRQDSVRETAAKHQASFPDRPRSEASISSYRSAPRVVARINALCDLLGDLPAETVRQVECNDTGDRLNVSTPKGLRLVKPALLLEKADIPYEVHGDKLQPLHYDIERVRLNEWPTTLKGADGQPIQVSNYQTTVRLTRRGDVHTLKAMEALIERAGKLSERVPRRTVAQPERPHLLEVCIPDLHVGKLAHSRESGADYDSHIARRRFEEALSDILDRAASYPISQVLFLVGSDLLHTDNDQATTYAGTPQDVDSRLHKIIETTYEMLIEGIRECSRIAPVVCKTVPGNHDRQQALHAGRYLQAWFANDDNVEVEVEPRTRKYHEWGKCLIGLAHGDQESPKDLPMIMAQELPQVWGRTEYREWHIGHVHHKREFQALAVDERTGVRVRHLSSLSRSDAWHTRRGYMAQQAAEGFVWCKDRGLQSIIHHTPDHWTQD